MIFHTKTTIDVLIDVSIFQLSQIKKYCIIKYCDCRNVTNRIISYTPVDVIQLDSVPVVLQLTGVRHQVVVLQTEGLQHHWGSRFDINGTLSLSFANIPPVCRSVSTLNDLVITGFDWF